MSFHVPLLKEPGAAAEVLSQALGITTTAARGGIQALLRAGWVVAPREPTNSMLAASVNATAVSANPLKVVNAIAKARLRWKAMANEGSKAAMSNTGHGRCWPTIRANLYREAAAHLERRAPEVAALSHHADAAGFVAAAAELRRVAGRMETHNGGDGR
jgi:hypothetical protein